MDVPLEIAFHNLDSSPALMRLIRERADRMQRRFSRVNSCRVVVEPAARRLRQRDMKLGRRQAAPLAAGDVAHDDGGTRRVAAQ